MMKKRQITQASVPEGVIDLGVGQPQVDLLPLDKINLAWEHQVKQSNPEILQYGMQKRSWKGLPSMTWDFSRVFVFRARTG
ncbi:MAG: hypothetical protein ABFS43_11140 [Thermodesulfobacteriota bacterium]